MSSSVWDSLYLFYLSSLVWTSNAPVFKFKYLNPLVEWFASLRAPRSYWYTGDNPHRNLLLPTNFPVVRIATVYRSCVLFSWRIDLWECLRLVPTPVLSSISELQAQKLDCFDGRILPSGSRMSMVVHWSDVFCLRQCSDKVSYHRIEPLFVHRPVITSHGSLTSRLSNLLLFWYASKGDAGWLEGDAL